MKGFLNKCEKTQYMSSVINDEKILEKYGLIWNKISVIIKKEFDAQPVYSEKYVSPKIKSHNSKIKTENNGTKLHTEKSACYCLSKTLFDSVCKKMEMINIIHKFIWRSVNIRKGKEGRSAWKKKK